MDGVIPNYRKTTLACFIGVVTQAVVTNITAVLFVPFMLLYGFNLWQLGILVSVNFVSQMLADFALTFLIDKISFRKITSFATLMSAAGLILFASSPYIFANHIFVGMIISTIIFSFASGMLEVVLSPIVDNLPDTFAAKGKAMAMLHSFYAWGQAFCIIVTAVFLIFFSSYWNLIVYIWAIPPIICFFVFLTAPIEQKKSENITMSGLKLLINPVFILCLFAILLGGASEVTMNQWVSTFAVTALGVDKSIADLVGMTLFAVTLGIGRLLYGLFGDKVNLNKTLAIGSLLTAGLYLVVGLVDLPIVALIAGGMCGLTTALLWPGTLVVASKLFKNAGAVLFALLAVFGDLGGSIFPAVTGFLAESTSLKTAVIVMSIVPFVGALAHMFIGILSKRTRSLYESTGN